jgi:cysteinyl-tRNA synthetase
VVDGKKMSKSLGNFFTINDVVNKGFEPMDLRYLMLNSQYRETLNFTWDSLKAAENGLLKLKSQISDLRSGDDRTTLSPEKETKIEDFRNGFKAALVDDLNTPKALAVMWEMLKSNIPSGDKYDLAMSFDEVLGLRLAQIPNSKFQIPNEIKKLVEEREKLRKEEKFKEADEVRDKIEKLGFRIEDSETGPAVKPVK